MPLGKKFKQIYDIIIKSHSDDFISFTTNHKYILYFIMLIISINFFFFQDSFLKLALSWISFCFSGFLILYRYLNIPRTLLSFVFFSFNLSIGCFFIRGIYFVYFEGLDKPIYVEDISSFSQYRYLLLSVLYICLIIFLIMSIKSTRIKNILSTYNFSFFKEELIVIIQTCPRLELLFNKCCNYILNAMLFSSKAKLLYFCIHFCIHYVYRIIILLFFVNFSFFHGDLRYILYCLPLSFFFWLCSFAWCFFLWFYHENFDNVRDCLSVTLLDETLCSKTTNGNFQTLESNFEFELTPYALKERPYLENFLPQMKLLWINFSNLNSSFEHYNRKVSYLSFIILSIYIICWLNINKSFIDLSFTNFMTPNSGFFFIICRSFSTTRPAFYPRQGYWILDEKTDE